MQPRRVQHTLAWYQVLFDVTHRGSRKILSPMPLADESQLDSRMLRQKRSLFLAFDRERDGVSAAQAQRRDAALQVAPLQLIKQRGQNARAGRADGMAQRHRTAVHIHFFW